MKRIAFLLAVLLATGVIIAAQGGGLALSEQRARELDFYLSFKEGAAKGNPVAQGMLGHCYASGIGVPKDLEQAAYWFTKAAEWGLDIFQYELGKMYLDGQGLPRNEELAEKWLQRAAKQGNKEAQERLASLYATPSFLARLAEKKNRTWFSGSDWSYEYLVVGRRSRGIRTDKLNVAVLLDAFDDPIRVLVTIQNRSDGRIDVYPEKFSLEVVEPRPMVLAYVSPADIVKKIKRDAAWMAAAEAMNSMSRAFAGTSTTVTSGSVSAWNLKGGSAYGTYNGITTTYDAVANQQLTSANMARIAELSELQQVSQTSGVMLPNTLFADEHYSGYVHFKRDKKAKQLMLTLRIEDYTLKIPLLPSGL